MKFFSDVVCNMHTVLVYLNIDSQQYIDQYLVVGKCGHYKRPGGIIAMVLTLALSTTGSQWDSIMRGWRTNVSVCVEPNDVCPPSGEWLCDRPDMCQQVMILLDSGHHAHSALGTLPLYSVLTCTSMYSNTGVCY